MKSERRYKTIALHPDSILNLFSTKMNDPDAQWVNRLIFEGMPEDCTIKFHEYSNMRQCWLFVLYHPSFDVVPDYETPPELPCVATPVRILRYSLMPDLPVPETEDLSIERDANGNITRRIAQFKETIQWERSEEGQMLRYGILGWTRLGVAIFQPGCGPTDGTIIVRNKEAAEQYTSRFTKSNPIMNGTFLRSID